MKIFGPEFRKQARKVAASLDGRLESIDKLYRRRLQQHGFDKRQVDLLLTASPAAALAALNGKGPKTLLETIDAAGRQLAKWNVHPDRIAAALQSFGELLGEARDHDAAGLKSVVDQLQFTIILTLNRAYFSVRESESRFVFEAYRVTLESLDLYASMRRFIETITNHVGASAGHIFLLNETREVWELKGSTAKAVSPEAVLATAVKRPIANKLRDAQEIRSARSRSALLLDPGWNEAWPHCWSVPMFFRGELGGVMQLAFHAPVTLAPRDLEMLAVVGEQCLASADRTRLIESVAVREQRMFQLARRMLQIEEIERRRISRELHDDAGQSLVVIRLQMEMIEQSMPPDAAEWRERLAEARDLTESTILHVRRLIAELSPAVMEQLGLAAGLRQLVTRFRRSYVCRVHLHIGKLPQMFPDFQIVVYRLAQECLTNISKHSSAKHVNISLTTADRVLRLHVEDDGVGFHVDEGLSRSHCFGLVGMRERVALLGGSCEIRSTPKRGEFSTRAKNTGTEIEIQLPIPAIFPSPTS